MQQYNKSIRIKYKTMVIVKIAHSLMAFVSLIVSRICFLPINPLKSARCCACEDVTPYVCCHHSIFNMLHDYHSMLPGIFVSLKRS